MNRTQMRYLLSAAAVLAMTVSASAATYTQTVDNQSWLNAVWGSPAAAPSAGNDYVTADLVSGEGILRTSPVGSTGGGNATFPGTSVTVVPGVRFLAKQVEGETASINGGSGDLIVQSNNRISFAPNGNSIYSGAATLDVGFLNYTDPGVGQSIFDIGGQLNDVHVAGTLTGPGNVTFQAEYGTDTFAHLITIDAVSAYSGDIIVNHYIQLDFNGDCTFSGSMSLNDNSTLVVDQTLAIGSGQLTANGVTIADGTYSGSALTALGARFADGGGALVVGAADPCFNEPPLIEGESTLSAFTDRPVLIDVTAGDDGKPYVEGCDPGNPDVGTAYPLEYLWSQQSGPAAAVFNPAAADTEDVTVTFPTAGTYELVLEVWDAPVGVTDRKSTQFLVTASVAEALSGDINGNGYVYLDDLTLLAEQWLTACLPGAENCADLNNSGQVTLDDYLKVAANWLQQQSVTPVDEDGYDLWLRYHTISPPWLLDAYHSTISAIYTDGTSPILETAKNELQTGLSGLLNQSIPLTGSDTADGCIILSTSASYFAMSPDINTFYQNDIGSEGFVIKSLSGNRTFIGGKTEKGVLYGIFHFLRLLQTQEDIQNVTVMSAPRIQRRMLNHWDNLNGSVERGYAGSSIWRWSELPGTISPRYTDYARACASIGINGMCPTNVNADATSLTTSYLDKLAAIADVMRPYGIQVYLTARFSAPKEIGGLSTADPLDASVINWWDSKVNEIYTKIPDFGGFLVKANSEGQPGPQDYGRTHADGANMMANALDEHGGVVIWRAFVYANISESDRIKHAYLEFNPLDGQFNDNVFIQIKNGPLDFQPLEPFTALFGDLESTKYGAELQITQEYLGHSTHLVYLAPMWKEFLDFDTHAYGSGSTVAKTLDGSLRQTDTLIAGVANIGDNTNWCGHHFAQANWYAFGRLAWDHTLTSDAIADEWTQMTWTHTDETVVAIKDIMLGSWQAAHDYFTPIGLTLLCEMGPHYAPSPSIRTSFHKADSAGLGYNRTTTGSNAVSQYAAPVRDLFNNLATCPEEYLMWFHHVSWNHTMASGRTMWDELCFRYYGGAAHTADMIVQWDSLNGAVDSARFDHVRSRLTSQNSHAIQWRDTCVNYFQGYSNKPLPSGLPQ